MEKINTKEIISKEYNNIFNQLKNGNIIRFRNYEEDALMENNNFVYEYYKIIDIDRNINSLFSNNTNLISRIYYYIKENYENELNIDFFDLFNLKEIKNEKSDRLIVNHISQQDEENIIFLSKNGFVTLKEDEINHFHITTTLNKYNLIFVYDIIVDSIEYIEIRCCGIFENRKVFELNLIKNLNDINFDYNIIDKKNYFFEILEFLNFKKEYNKKLIKNKKIEILFEEWKQYRNKIKKALLTGLLRN